MAVEVTIESGTETHRLVIAVSDTGAGVPPDMREAIFSEFTQADDSITRRYGGVGLGLAISRRMAERMGGSLTLDPPAPVGSRFTLVLPVALAQPPSQQGPVPPALIGPAKRVLIVDDDEINRSVAERMLARLGHEVVTVSSGPDALAALAATTFNVILMDLRMPHMDGTEVARRIRQCDVPECHRVRIIAMTAEYGDNVWEECARAGMDGRLLKPIDLERLAGAVSGHVLSLPVRDSRTPIDIGYVKEQSAILGGAETTRLVRMFNTLARRSLAALEVAADGADLNRTAISEIAHRLRGSSGNLGLADFADLAGRLEAAARTASQQDLQALIGLLKTARITGLKSLKALSRASKEQQ